LDEDAADGVVTIGCSGAADALAFLEGLGFGEAEAEENNQNRRASAKPEEGAPAVGGCIDEGAGEGCGEEVSEGVLLWSGSLYGN
jgi:hypothetical protein